MTTLHSHLPASLADLVRRLGNHDGLAPRQVDQILDRLEAVWPHRCDHFGADPFALPGLQTHAAQTALNPFAIQSAMDPRAAAYFAAQQARAQIMRSAAPALFMDPQLLSAMILMSLLNHNQSPASGLGQLANFARDFVRSGGWNGSRANSSGGFRDRDSFESGDGSAYSSDGACFISQYDGRVPRAGDSACYRACREMAKRSGVNVPAATTNRIQVATSENGVGQVRTTRDRTTRARNYIDSELAAGRPVTVGVSHKDSNINRDGITDHYVLITGKGVDSQGRTFYEYNDPATRSPANGAGKRFYADAETGNLVHAGSVASGYVVNRHTELSMVVRNA